jgi:hypothetical protein
VAELTTPDGKPAEVDPADTEREFARAMAADAPGDEPAAPPKRQEPAEQPARPRRGRPPKSEQARVTKGTPATTPALTPVQRREGVKGLVQLGAGMCLVASKATGQDAFKADAITLASSAPEWADACVSVAESDPKFARVLDKVCAAGPYSALISVAVSTSMQLVRNHRPTAALPGTVAPAELIAQAEAQPEPVAA